jgi:mono/diheme cytochrome c family protein
MTPGKLALCLSAVIGLSAPFALQAQQAAAPEVTFSKQIAPILQRSCQNCHRPDGVAPMALTTYDEVRPWARAIKQRTGIGPRAGVMPPWYVEKNIGIQQFHNDPSLSDDEIAMIAKWADSGAPRGNPADMPPPKVWPDGKAWAIGTPDLIVKSTDILVKGDAPDWWGEIPSMPTGLTEGSGYVAALEIKEVKRRPIRDGGPNPRRQVGGPLRFIHMIWRTQVLIQGGDRRPPDRSDISRTRKPVELGRVPLKWRNAELLRSDVGRGC